MNFKILQKISFILLWLFSSSLHAQLPLLKISANRRYFQTADQQPFFWLGDTGWLLFTKLNREETIQYLDTRKQQGFNVVQVMVLHDIDHAVNRYGDSALENHNVATPHITPGSDFHKPAEYDFWDHVDFVIDEASKRGIYMALVPVWGTNVKGGRVSKAEAKTYTIFLANRYKDKPNIIWLNGGDIKGTDSMETWKTIGSNLRQYDKNHLIGFHPRGRTSSSDWFQNEPWLDFNMFQSGHRNYAQDTSFNEPRHYGEDNWKYVNEDYALTPTRPVLDGEPSYEEIPQGLHDTTQPYWNDADVRRYAYWSVFTGAAGFTYGNNAVMQFFNSTDKGKSAYGAREFWQQAVNDAGAKQMQYLKQLLLSKPYFERIPDSTMILNSGERYDKLVALRGRDYAWIYTSNGHPIRVQLGNLQGSSVHVSWYNPGNGKYTKQENYPNKGVATFDPPGELMNGNDWVLVLEITR